jgi:hypothetical protein
MPAIDIWGGSIESTSAGEISGGQRNTIPDLSFSVIEKINPYQSLLNATSAARWSLLSVSLSIIHRYGGWAVVFGIMMCRLITGGLGIFLSDINPIIDNMDKKEGGKSKTTISDWDSESAPLLIAKARKSAILGVGYNDTWLERCPQSKLLIILVS